MSRKINSRDYYNSEIDTLKKVVKKLKPRKIIPIHTFYPDKYGGLFRRKIVQISGGEGFVVQRWNAIGFSVLFTIKGQLIIGGNIVLDREVVRDFLDEELSKTKIPKDISKEAIVETFCKYIEDDYYDCLKDNFKSFF